MTCRATFVTNKTRPSALDIRVCAQTSPREKQGIFGPVRTAESLVSEDVLLLSVQRLLLTYQIKEASRQHKATSTLTKRLRDVTHRLLGAV